MRDIHNFIAPTVPIDLSPVAVKLAITLHYEATNLYPSTLICGMENAFEAYNIMRESDIKLVIVVAPGFPRSSWMICSSDYAVYSEGA